MTIPTTAPARRFQRVLQRHRAGWHILVPVDYSGRSWRALDFAVSLAGPLQGKISLLHVVLPDTHPLTQPCRQFRLPEAMARCRSRLARLQAVLHRRGLAGAVQVRVGLPFQQILAAARELSADLLVLTTHGRTGLPRLLAGSIAEVVLRHASCPVIVLRFDAVTPCYSRVP